MDPLGLVKLHALMERTSGRPELRIGLIDGPVGVPTSRFGGRTPPPGSRTDGSGCTETTSAACLHGTFVAGILSASAERWLRRSAPSAPCSVRPIFTEAAGADGEMPSAAPEELAEAILDCLDAGARVLNVSAALAQSAIKNERALKEALDQAAQRGAIVIAAAGNQGTLGGTAITSHPWVIPVVAYDLEGRPMHLSNLGSSIGRRGMGAPGDRVTSLGAHGKPLTLGGTSAAAPFVTGAIALLWSEFPGATATEIKLAATQASSPRRMSVLPPLLDAWAAYQKMRS